MVQSISDNADTSGRSRHRDVAIDTRLGEDCHDLGTLERARLLLHREASAGWLILVPDTPAIDWHELDDAEFELINHQIRQLCRWAAEWFGADKMNIATIGNQVPQMHIHIVARHYHDPWWPKPVWGSSPDTPTAYEAESVQTMREALARDLKLMPAED